jgi:Ca2+-binding EF-hand superfamily protein
LDIEDLKKCTQFLEQNFSEDELEELLELSGKSNGKLTFDNFM